jgi:hypothetical protein
MGMTNNPDGGNSATMRSPLAKCGAQIVAFASEAENLKAKMAEAKKIYTEVTEYYLLAKDRESDEFFLLWEELFKHSVLTVERAKKEGRVA